MEKSFFDVFSEIHIDTHLQSLLSDARVLRISTNRDKSKMRLYIRFQSLIPKRNILKLEELIENQYFHDRSMKVCIIESFALSDVYTPESFFADYKDSMLEEIGKVSSITYNLVKKADFDFRDNGFWITMEDTAVAKSREDEILSYFRDVFYKRCDFQIPIDIAYKTAQKTKYIKAQDEKIARAIDHILENAAAAALMEGSAQEAPAPEQENKSFKKNEPKKKDSKEEEPDVKLRPFRKEGIKNLLYGYKEITEDAIPLEEVFDGIGEVVLKGEILSVESREIKNNKTIVSFHLSDYTDTLTGDIFIPTPQAEELLGLLKKKSFIKLFGTVSYNNYTRDISISRIKSIVSIPDFRAKRMDLSTEKRVELHCHTKMSDMDGVSDVGDIIKQAISFGHKAIAITDHGVVQSFPTAAHSIPPDSDFKVIYGCEGYLVDDTKQIVTDDAGQTLSDSFVVFDLETTGLNAKKCKIIEIGAVRFENGRITERFSEFVNPRIPIPFEITKLTGITDDMVRDAQEISDVLPRFFEFSKGAVMVAHNADFDCNVIKSQCLMLSLDWKFTYLDTVSLSQFLLPHLKKYKLDVVAKDLNVSLENHHRAVDDAECTAYIFEKLLKKLSERDIKTLQQLNEAGKMTVERIRSAHPNHIILLAKNDIGRINLYKLVSLSHLEYFQRVPKLPKSLIEENREGLIIGSACEQGELYQAVLLGRSDAELVRIASFYDYLEIQPNGNNAFMLREEKYNIHSEEDLNDINRKIIALGETLHKPVVATCDVHFLNPEDEIYRRIIMAGKGFKDADEQAPLYLHTTEEMLEEFSYLGREKAEEVVIQNPNRIADMCDYIKPTRPDKCPPVIENSDEMLRKICYTKAHEMYGEDLPPIVSERLERELNSIISNGYAVMYIIAQKLVWKSVEDGYLVGSRGSVGSSFAATMAGITEVNPLSPHYLCRSCHYVDFDSEEVKAYAGRAGVDMPDKNCPVCGKPLSKEGFDIPFETFLGFKGNKEPDIDLNFSGEYQNKAHKYTEVIFGEGQTFKAGTVGTLADKTAFGYAKHYFEERGINKHSAEIDRIVTGCVGVRRTTGQHPGGIIVLPVGEDIYSFTPIQHPANDMTTDIITTHFDYHSIDENLLKLDILGHDDPTMIRKLEDLTGEDATKFPLDDKQVMSLFQDTSALGVTPEELWNVDRGTLGIPEFGTDFAMGMLRDAKPKEFTDLIRIAGLAHGTDVWLGNAQTLLEEGKATISTAICTRDDIMTYLIQMGLDSEESFKIMEMVRKGKVAAKKAEKWPQWKEDMIAHGVPDWYIWSCEKIKYMFPKAHAAAYVMMAWRVAYCKIYFPLAYYAAFFSIRATAFDYEKMCRGKATVEAHLTELDRQSKERKLSAKENDLYRDLRIVHEMYARGFAFLPMDLYESDAKNFKIVDGKLLPPFKTIEGMGDTAAESLAIAASQKKFTSVDDIKNRGKITQTTIDKMKELGIISGLPQSAQLSIFDIM
ncbi:MAG: PolC-type DNA polymerase III [Lachnospiraceae bacterium]|nr:PolC-type DNA polymerase III [Lachnospiraceae bacterium]